MSTGYWFGEERDYKVVTGLLSACYEQPYDAEYVQWMGRRSRWFVAYKDAMPVGCYGIALLSFKSNGVLIDVGLVNNVGIVRKHRGGTLFADLALWALSEFGATGYLGISNDAALPGHLRAGWKHCNDVGFAEGRVPNGEFGAWWPEWYGCYNIRDDDWRTWRYSKPGECYKTTGDVVFKVRDNVVQVVESPDIETVGCFGAGVKVGIMTSTSSGLWGELHNHGFAERFRRHVVVRGALCACMPPRVEPCEYDVF